MSDKVDKAVERLADALFDEVMAALAAKSFYPSQRFQAALHDLIRNDISMG